MTDTFYSLKEAASYAHVTRQAIYIAIRKKRLIAVKPKGQWVVSKSDLDDYRLSKYNRDLKKDEDGYIFDIEKGYFSVPQVCKVISASIGRPYPIQHIYYLLRRGKLKALRRGVSWVIHRDDAIELLRKETGMDVRFG